jgi:hypothetical protein
MIKIAHRGYINGDHPKNSLSALGKAIELGYDMIEIDIRETKDKEIILNHDEDLMRLFKIEAKVKDLVLNELKKFKFSNLIDKILSFEDCLKLCQDKVGLLIEVKDKVYSESYLKNIYQALVKWKMVEQVIIYPPRGDLIDFYLGKVRVGLNYEQFFKIKGEEGLVDKVVVLEMPDRWDKNTIEDIHRQNSITLTTVKQTYFDRKFSTGDHLKLAWQTIDELKKLGIDGINIDSIYHDFLFETKSS